MTSVANLGDRRKLAAYAGPMILFLLLFAPVSLLPKTGNSFWLRSPEFWVYPAQTFLCAGMLLWFRREYEWHRLHGIIFTLVVALLVFVLWISPQAFMAFAPRTDGFNPDLLTAGSAGYGWTLGLRFLRLVVVVPFVEEIFWRGFLLRYLIAEDFANVPFGKFSWLSFSAVVLGFTLAHRSPDWPAAFVTGILYNLIAYRTRSLTSCILAHAVTNLCLGLWIMQTKQWGFW